MWPRQWPSAMFRLMLMASRSVVDLLGICGRRQSISLLLTNQPWNLEYVFLSFFSFSVDQGFRVFHQSKRVYFSYQFPLGYEVFLLTLEDFLPPTIRIQLTTNVLLYAWQSSRSRMEAIVMNQVRNLLT